MWLLAGLGNPGERYAGNRHNVGFMAADAISARYEFSSYLKKFGGLFTDGRIANQRLLLLKPMTFMNRSGLPVAEALGFYRLPPERLIVVHDELDLPLGGVRVKKGGGAGGHNGIKDIDRIVGPDYFRVRVGIGHPGDKNLVTDYVLSDFRPEEVRAINAVLSAIAQHLPFLLTQEAAAFSNAVKTTAAAGLG
ncbi:MAG: aminoacyl-tRNA hydrolase [Alphaproteobacteria bacterium]|nr:aminoacyl-tRNA hydrolase [Alphaproteobacteria bacterium]